MIETYKIAGYCRISVDMEQDRDNTSIENQKMIIEDYVKQKFKGSELDFFEDRDRSGYTFEQREAYQKLRPLLLNHQYDILVVKDFSRFSRRNSKGLVELEDLRDVGVRIISIGDGIDYPTYDDWTSIQFRFLINEMPVTDTSKKVKRVVEGRQNEGKWICSVPYGYIITNTKNMTYKVDEPAAEVVRKVYELYNQGWGYKKIANHLTELNIPTPRLSEKERKEADGSDTKIKAKREWSIITIQGILQNDFYIGTLRQRKYKRKKINGANIKIDENDHIVFENHHEPIIDYRTFAITKEQLKKRTTTNYRGVKVNDNVYSGFLYCGDCGSPLFSMSRRDLAPAYTCGTYHKRGLSGCTAHHTRVDMLDGLLKSYIKSVKANSTEMISKLELSLKNETEEIKNNQETVDILEKQLEDSREELKATMRQKVREIMRNPDKERIIEETFNEMINEVQNRIAGLENQIQLTADKRNTIIKVNRIAKTALEIFDEVLNKEHLDKSDLDLIIEKITVYNDHIDIELKSDIDMLLKLGKLENSGVEDIPVNFNSGTEDIEKGKVILSYKNRQDKVLGVNVICNGDPLEIYTDKDGEVIFKKYSLIGEISAFSSGYAEILSKNCNNTIVITDKDTVVAVGGMQKKDIIDRKISPDIEKVMESRKLYSYEANDTRKLFVCDNVEKYICSAIAPITSEGDVLGSIVIVSQEKAVPASESDIRLITTAAQLIGKQMEE